MAKPFAPPYGNGVCHDPPQPGCTDTARDDTIRFTFTVPDGWASNDSGAAINKPATGYRGARWDGSPLPPWRLAVQRPLHQGRRPRNCRTSRSDRASTTSPTRLPTIPSSTLRLPRASRSVDTAGNTWTSSPSTSRSSYPADIPTCTFGYYPWVPSMPAMGPSHKWHLWILDVEGIRVVVQTADFAGTTASDLAELQAIVDSIQIEP